jgi:hypothetical protein
MHALPRMCSEAMSPSFKAMMAPSLLFSSSSWAMSYFVAPPSPSMSPLHPEEERTYTHQQAVINIMLISKPKKSSTLAGTQPTRCRGLIGASRCPHRARQRRLAIVARAPAPRALATIIIPDHLKQGNGASFNTRGEEGCCCSYSLKIERAG